MQIRSIFEEIFSPNQSVQIEFRDAFKNKRVYKTIIKSLTEDRLFLELLLSKDLISDLVVNPKTKAVIICHDPQHDQNHFFSAEIIEFSVTNPVIITLSRPVPFQNTSRRDFFRCDVNLYFSYYLNLEKYQGKITNLSASGLYANARHNPGLHALEVISCEMFLPNYPEPLQFPGRIIRIERNYLNEDGFALKFENPTEKFQNQIIKYLFQRQRELIKSGHIKAGVIY